MLSEEYLVSPGMVNADTDMLYSRERFGVVCTILIPSCFTLIFCHERAEALTFYSLVIEDKNTNESLAYDDNSGFYIGIPYPLLSLFSMYYFGHHNCCCLRTSIGLFCESDL